MVSRGQTSILSFVAVTFLILGILVTAPFYINLVNDSGITDSFVLFLLYIGPFAFFLAAIIAFFVFNAVGAGS